MKPDTRLVTTSKFLNLVLRHQPEVVGMKLDHEGWLAMDGLIVNATQCGHALTLELLHEVVANNDKQRFALSDDGLRIRANQGHFVTGVDLKLVSGTLSAPRLTIGRVRGDIDHFSTLGGRSR